MRYPQNAKTDLRVKPNWYQSGCPLFFAWGCMYIGCNIFFVNSGIIYRFYF